MHYLLSEIDNQIHNLYIKRDDISFDIFYKVSMLYYKILQKTLKELENIYYLNILKPRLNEINNLSYILCIIIMTKKWISPFSSLK